MTGAVCVAGVGAHTPLGPSSVTSWLALRAGISGVREHDQMVDGNGEKVSGGIDPELDPALLGPDRLIALLNLALADLSASIPASFANAAPIPLVVSVPEIRPGFSNVDVGEFRGKLDRQISGPINIGTIYIRATGHAGGIEALGLAASSIHQEKSDAIVVAGTESYFHPDTIDWLERHRQLLNATSRSAFVPGEGAGACLVVSEARARMQGVTSLQPILGISRATERCLIKSDCVCLGHGLSEAAALIVESLGEEERINAIISDQNGERYRSDEWGFMAIRHGRYFDDVTDYVAPAAWWGDMGAASGPLFASFAFLNGLNDPRPRTLLAGSSEGGLRAMLMLGRRSDVGRRV